jgi:hypothetical protein
VTNATAAGLVQLIIVGALTVAVFLYYAFDHRMRHIATVATSYLLLTAVSFGLVGWRFWLALAAYLLGDYALVWMWMHGRKQAKAGA